MPNKTLDPHRPVYLVWCTLVLTGLLPVAAHEVQGHRGPTCEISAPVPVEEGRPQLNLSVLDGATGRPTPTRFSLEVDGQVYTPSALGKNGLRFESIHVGKRQRFTALYTRGTGAVYVPLPPGAQEGTIHLAKGLEYLPQSISFRLLGDNAQVTATMDRWTDLRSQGWISVEEHLHYERTDPAHNQDWFTILAGDDLAQGHFLTLKGGNLPGVWAQQYAYGQEGQARDAGQLICSGEEYRDGLQGHINLLGIADVIPPILAGTAEHPYHYPTLYDVLQRAKTQGALVGPAHGTALGRSPTGIVDTVLGAVDFFEIANTHLYHTDVWYRLMNCGFIVPPAAGTDLPNFPFRDAWQPLLGEVRTYVNTGGKVDFESCKQAVRNGKTFVTSGPMIVVTVDGVGPGGTVRLPLGGGDVLVEAELSSPRSLASFDILLNSEELPVQIEKGQEGPIHRWRISQRVPITRSSWLAARGVGISKQALHQHTGIAQNTMAHTAPIHISVADEPIESAEDATYLIDHLQEQIAFYRAKANYRQPKDRDRAMALFHEAIGELQGQAD